MKTKNENKRNSNKKKHEKKYIRNRCRQYGDSDAMRAETEKKRKQQ